MHPYVATLGISGLLVLAGTVLSCFGAPHTEDAASDDAALAAKGGHHMAGAHDWSGGKGTTPTSGDPRLERRSQIVIDDDASFNPANGVRGGSGSFDDPFVISGWHVDTIYIHDTSKAFEIKENYITDILILDWTGQGGYVHHNYVANLRTNRNVERTGDPSATVIENNNITRVEELRHFDGVVAHNTIGREPTLGLLDLSQDVVLNIAGLNGAGIHDNLILGGVDMKIHGHHHSDATGAHSHNHGKPDEAQREDHVEDHQTRYVDFMFYNNTIRDTGFGLRYNDLNHAGDDRTATSENEPDLEKPHIHYTRVALVNNVIEGAALRVQILNAQDERHVAGERAELVIQGNRIVDPQAGDGLVVADVRNAVVHVQGNRVEYGDGTCDVAADPVRCAQATTQKLLEGRGLPVSGTSAILLARFVNSTVLVHDNELGAYTYGIRAAEFDANTTWAVGENKASASEYPVYWDDSVANAPEGAEGETHEEHEHQHEDAVAPTIMSRLRL